MGSLDGRVALVTGGGAGIGRASAQLFAREGAQVVGADIDDAGGAGTVALIEAAHGEASFVHADVSRPTRWRAWSVTRSSASVGSTAR